MGGGRSHLVICNVGYDMTWDDVKAMAITEALTEREQQALELLGAV